MALDINAVTRVDAPECRGSQLVLSWHSDKPDGTVFHVYYGHTKVYAGEDRAVVLPRPRARTLVTIGAVLPAERTVDLSWQVAASYLTRTRPRLTWTGGDHLASSGRLVRSYRVYGEDEAGGGLNTSAWWAEIPAVEVAPRWGTSGFGVGGFGVGGFGTGEAIAAAGRAGAGRTGFGLGGFGGGGFGTGSVTYRWTGPVLEAGEWAFRVVAVDDAGQEGSPIDTSVTIEGPHPAPALDSLGRRCRVEPSLGGFRLAWEAAGGLGAGSGYGGGPPI